MRKTHPSIVKILALFFFSFLILPLKASHILGGELAFVRVSQQTYHLQLTLYRDCSGAALGTGPQVVTVTQLGTTNTINVNLALMSQGLEVNNCAGLVTFCSNTASTIPGIEKYVYQGIVTLPFQNVDYEVKYSMCCRATAITNLVIPTSESFTIRTLLRDGVNAHSAVFDPMTQPFLCQGQANSLSFHATDADGDSLVYTLIPAASDTNSVVYAAGASFSQPILNAPSQTFDSQNGFLSFNTSAVQYSVVAVRVDEYQNGVLVGYTERDITTMIVPCQVTCGPNLIQGKVYRDNDQNCQSSSVDQNLIGWMVRLDPGPYYVPTDLNGNYSMAVLPGNYTVSVVVPSNGLWNLDCPATGSYNINFAGTGGSATNQDFALSPNALCAEMWIDIGSNLIRPCSTTVYQVQYCNQGTDTAYNAYATVELDPALTYVSSSIPVASVTNQTYQFNLGNVSPGACGGFSINVLVDCDTNLVNQTLCAEAHIYPDSVCQPVNAGWDRSSVVVNGVCQDSVVCFTVENTGSPSNGNMTGPTDWRLFENGVQILSGTLQLCGGCDTTLCFTANGNTLRLEVDQRPGHPGNSHPNDVVELCGSPGNTVGLVNAQPQDDMDVFVSIDCRQVTNSYDPNQKSVVPSGLTDQHHYIDSTDVLEYLVDFQNLGTGPAYDIVVEDVLDSLLDLSTLQMGASSHPYTYRIDAGRKLRVEFKSIILPAAISDYNASMGWFKYSIKQVPGNSYGDEILNRADIYFDFNAPVLTNVTWNTIGWPQTLSVHPTLDKQMGTIKLYPNPGQGNATLLVEGLVSSKKLDIQIWDMMGRLQTTQVAMPGAELPIELENPVSGIYLVQVRQEGLLIGVVRMVVD